MSIKEYLLQNPIDRTQQNPYDSAALRLGVDKEVVREVWRRLRRKGLVEKGLVQQLNDLSPSAEEYLKNIRKIISCGEYSEERKNDGSVRIQDTVDRKLTDKELFERYGRNDKEWKIISVWFKDKQNGFLLSVHFAPIKIETNLELQKEAILEEIKKYSPKVATKHELFPKYGSYLLEIAIFDAHFGKLSHKEEVGEDYDLKIAVQRYEKAIDDLLDKVDTSQIGRILFPIGNDLFNVDNINKTTSNFTPQDTDTRFHKMITTVKKLLIETIERLSAIAPVDVIVVAGNHDLSTTFMCGEILEAFFHNNENVVIDNSPKLRKYYIYGNTSFMFTHGDREKHASLGMIFAAERPDIWAASTQRYIQLGHYHHNKNISYLAKDEYQGFQIVILPSLSPNDAWHCGKGYSAQRQAKAFLYDEEDGLVAEITHTA